MQGKLTRKDIVAAVGGRFFARGRDYFERGRVISVEINEETPEWVRLDARVRGSGGRIYEQTIEIEWLKDFVQVSGTCSCPMDFDCKHVAAACLSYIADPPVPARGALDDALAEGEDSGVLRWLVGIADAGREQIPDARAESLIYLLKPADKPRSGGVDIELRVARPRQRGGGLTKGRTVTLSTLVDAYHSPAYLRPEDGNVLTLLRALLPSYWGSSPELRGGTGYLALERMIATGRCFWGDTQGPALAPGEPRKLEIAWRDVPGDQLQLQLDPGPHSLLLATEPPAYLDTRAHQLGPLQSPGLSSAQLERLRDAPAFPKQRAETLSRTLVRRFPNLPLPTPTAIDLREITGAEPIPCLRLTGHKAPSGLVHALLLDFEYAGLRVPALPSAAHSTVDADAGLARVERDPTAEAEALQTLTDLGFELMPGYPFSAGPLPLYSPGGNSIISATRWSGFLQESLPELEARGWRVSRDASFMLRFEAGDWEAEVQEDERSGNDWFGLRFDLEVDGRRLPLLPLIAPLLEAGLERNLPDTLSIPLDPAGGSAEDAYRHVDLPTGRLIPFLDALRDLFDSGSISASGDIALSRFDALALQDLEASGTPVRGGRALLDFARRLSDFKGIRPADTPAGLKAELRAYQKHGLGWLQFLREFGLGGVLADDMGLGKTVQTLAHLLLEKESGRLDHPALVVAPTSLMGNWRREAARFAPGLRVLVLHGTGRQAHFDSLADYHLVLTTYALLPRDVETLSQHRFHSLILDEAQNIKNPRTRAAGVVRGLHARHRLCLTGTPMENHLGELWSLFDFLLPGFLGEETHFKRRWRTPIEQFGDSEKQQRLARRIAPFMLRRSKQDVLAELPPKTEIVRTVELGDEQAALYESIRLSMEKRVRDAIAAQGLARSHITILDALLKLRQTCCDPRLLSLAAAQKVEASAKLELLMDILPEQLEEGRRVLLFSQFTGMLGLIENELDGRKIGYSKLTGRTRKRDEAIERFRSGEADVFLISLKAGGVGLNLTEADTVIIYDPWWNPAVESQAADRAHRIGQDKPVFVYKLVTENTVEEKILALQAKKQALADGIYRDGTAATTAGFGAEELKELFAPLPPD
jgi:superfamily II DNA or RNA helicase